MRDLIRSKHFVVRLDEPNHVLLRARTTERFESLEELEASYADLLAALDSIDRRAFGQLIDAREAPPRNDPEFEAIVTRHHVDLYRGFRASAVLVRTAAGRLQVRRMLDASGIAVPVFLDEAEALAYLRA